MKSRQLCNGKLVNGVESPFFTITKEHDIDDLIQRSNIMKAYHCQSKFLKRHSPFTLALIEADARTVKVFLDAGLPRTGLLETGDPLEIIIDFSYTTRQSYYTPYYTDCVNSIANAPTANINLADLNPFAYACYKGQYHVVESFLLNNPYVGYNLDDEEGLAPITRACLKGRWQIVKLIARFSKYREIDIDCETIDGKNSVYHACRKNRLDVVKVLMKNGAQLTQLTHDHLTCFHFACALRQPKCKSIRLIKFVMSQASPHFLNMKTDSGKTAFMLACETGNLEAVKVIYESHNKLRMDLHCETDLGENAYDLAVLKKRTDVQKFLDESDFQIARDRKRKAADEAN
jgi:ankyrin repeat protein